jgi:ABC-type sugar transport system ATPase subunit
MTVVSSSPSDGVGTGPGAGVTAPETVTLRREVRDVVMRHGQVVALDGANFEARPGEVMGLMCDNGAGKSTLIKCVSGLRGYDSGTIEVDGEHSIPGEFNGVSVAEVERLAAGDASGRVSR